MLLRLIALDDELETIRFLNLLSDLEESEKLSLSDFPDLPDFPDEESLSLLLLLEPDELVYLRLLFFDGYFMLELLPNF